MNAKTIPATTKHMLRRGWIVGLGLAAVGAAAAAGCDKGHGTLFTRVAEARRLASDIRVQFNKAADASNRSVMADTDEASVAFAAEAEDAKKAVLRDFEALLPILHALDNSSELESIEEFRRNFAEYRNLDRTILALAVENSNLKAQKLSFGPSRESADAFRSALDSFGRAGAPKNSCNVCPLVYAAVVAVREIQVLQAPHVAQADDAAMTRMEKEMDDLEASARSAVRELSALAGAGAGAHLSAATAALDRFKETHATIIALSRKNTNVRSLAMSLGQKRGVTTACDSSLAALQNELAKEVFTATR